MSSYFPISAFNSPWFGDLWEGMKETLAVASTLPLEAISWFNAEKAEYQSHNELILDANTLHKVILVSDEIDPELTPIFMIHGIWSSAKQLYAAAYYLRECGIKNNIYIIELGKEDRSIREDALKVCHIASKVFEHHKHPSRALLLGHSRGGVVAAYAKEFFAKKEGMEIERVITVGAPFNGTTRAYRGPKSVQEELSRTPEGEPSPLLKDLLSSMVANPYDYYMIASQYDLLVVPNGRDSIPYFMPNTHFSIYAGWGGHSFMMRSSFVHQKIKCCLTASKEDISMQAVSDESEDLKLKEGML